MTDAPDLLEPHVVRALLFARHRPTRNTVTVLTKTVGLSLADVARAVDVVPATVGRWRRGGVPRHAPMYRLRDFAGVVAILAGTLTAKGIRQWLWAPNARLDGEPPIMVFAENAEGRTRVTAEARFLAGDGVA